jgi:Tfp pilus assembly protein PilF/glycosyltransferase involved in cell wall biosynthesis
MNLVRSLMAAWRPKSPEAAGTASDGIAACERGDLASAKGIAVALASAGRAAEAAWLRARVAMAEGNPDAAQAALREACVADPVEPVYCIELSQVLAAAGHVGEAIALLAPVLERPDHEAARDATLHFTLAGWHHACGDMPAARRSLEQAIGLDPDLIEARANLAALRFNEGETGSARALLQEGRRGPGTGLRRALYLPIAYRSRQEIDDTRARLGSDLDALEAADEGPLEHPEIDVGRTPFLLAYQGLDDRADMGRLARLIRRHYAAAKVPLIDGDMSPRDGRRRIGVVTAYFHHHSVGRAVLPLIEALDPREWDITLFACGAAVDDAYTQRLAALAPLVRLPGTVRTAAQAIARACQEVLVYPEIGMDTFTYFLAFWRLAPLQIALAGHPVTSGIDSIDVYFSDVDAEPQDAPQHYTESLRPLPGFHLPVHGLRHMPPLKPEGGPRVYLCTQTLIKLHPDFDTVLADVLSGDPQGQVALYGAPEESLNRIVMARLRCRVGAAIDRVTLLPRQSFDDYLATVRRATVVLDTLHFGGGNTTLEALAAGVPVVTSPGRFLRGRFAMARLRSLALDACIAPDHSSYGALAVAIARDMAMRRDITARLEQATPAALDPARPAQAFADALRALAPGARQTP